MKTAVRGDGAYTVTLTFRGGNTSAKSMGIDFDFRIMDAVTGEPVELADERGIVAADLLLASDDLRTVASVTGTPLGKGRVQFTHGTVPKSGRYKLVAQFRHGVDVVNTDFAVELP